MLKVGATVGHFPEIWVTKRSKVGETKHRNLNGEKNKIDNERLRKHSETFKVGSTKGKAMKLANRSKGGEYHD